VFKRKQLESEGTKCEQSWAVQCLFYEEQQLAPFHAEDEFIRRLLNFINCI